MTGRVLSWEEHVPLSLYLKGETLPPHFLKINHGNYTLLSQNVDSRSRHLGPHRPHGAAGSRHPFLVVMRNPGIVFNMQTAPDLSSSQHLVKALTLESHRMFCNDLLYPAAPSTPGPALQCGGADVEGRTPQLLEKGDKAPRPVRSRLRAVELNATPLGRSMPFDPDPIQSAGCSSLGGCTQPL